MENVRVRELRCRDVPQILAMAKSSFPEELALWSFNLAQAWAYYVSLAVWKPVQKLCGKPLFQFYVAEAERKAVAGAMVVWRQHYAYLQSVMVHPDFRRRGIGRRIVAHAVAEALRLCADKVVLHVRADNMPARRLYESLGFQAFEERVLLTKEAKVMPETKGWPAGFRLIRAGVGDPRSQEVAEAAREPEARAVYGPLKPSRNPVVRGFSRWFRPAWLLLETNGRAVASLSWTRSQPVLLSLHVLPAFRGTGLEKELLAWGVHRAPKKKLILRASNCDAPLVQAALDLGFREAMRDIGMVRGKGG